MMPRLGDVLTLRIAGALSVHDAENLTYEGGLESSRDSMIEFPTLDSSIEEVN